MVKRIGYEQKTWIMRILIEVFIQPTATITYPSVTRSNGGKGKGSSNSNAAVIEW